MPKATLAGRKVSAVHPLALLTMMSTGPSSASARSNSSGIRLVLVRSASTAMALRACSTIAEMTSVPSRARASAYSGGRSPVARLVSRR